MNIKRVEKAYKRATCTHSAWRMLIVGVPCIFGDFAWECTQCGATLRGRNPFANKGA